MVSTPIWGGYPDCCREVYHNLYDRRAVCEYINERYVKQDYTMDTVLGEYISERYSSAKTTHHCSGQMDWYVTTLWMTYIPSGNGGFQTH